jgi:HKD family nuclease
MEQRERVEQVVLVLPRKQVLQVLVAELEVQQEFFISVESLVTARFL